MEKRSGSAEDKEMVCKRCKESYRASSNTSFSCRFHPSFFVCRHHDDQKSSGCISQFTDRNQEFRMGCGCAIAYILRLKGFFLALKIQWIIDWMKRIDQVKMYYELGPNDPPYSAKFYDCCGAEDPEASGCTTSFHVSYDDD